VTSAPAPSEKSARQGHSVVISESEQASIRRDSGAAESDAAAAVSAASPSQVIPPVPPLPPSAQTWKAEALFECASLSHDYLRNPCSYHPQIKALQKTLMNCPSRNTKSLPSLTSPANGGRPSVVTESEAVRFLITVNFLCD